MEYLYGYCVEENFIVNTADGTLSSCGSKKYEPIAEVLRSIAEYDYQLVIDYMTKIFNSKLKNKKENLNLAISRLTFTEQMQMSPSITISRNHSGIQNTDVMYFYCTVDDVRRCTKYTLHIKEPENLHRGYQRHDEYDEDDSHDD